MVPRVWVSPTGFLASWLLAGQSTFSPSPCLPPICPGTPNPAYPSSVLEPLTLPTPDLSWNPLPCLPLICPGGPDLVLTPLPHALVIRRGTPGGEVHGCLLPAGFPTLRL